jgi:hypothetical protein
MSEIGTPGFCRDCPYWVAHDHHASKGTCRRFPPTAAVGAEKILPFTSHLDWCGEHPERRARGMKTVQRLFQTVRPAEEPPCEGCGVPYGNLHKPDCPQMAANAGAKAPSRKRKAA